MAEVYLNPTEFQEQIDNYEAATVNVKTLKYELDKQGVRLQSIDKYMECVELYNIAIKLLAQLLDQETKSMKQVKADWMHADNQNATKTIGEILFGE